jgi:hypothetical protein
MQWSLVPSTEACMCRNSLGQCSLAALTKPFEGTRSPCQKARNYLYEPTCAELT